MTPAELEAIKERRRKITEGAPWRVLNHGKTVYTDNDRSVCIVTGPTSYRDPGQVWKAEFIAHCPEDIDALLAALDELSSEVREWICEQCNTVYPGPPETGKLYVPCPKCKGMTIPRGIWERRTAERERDAARAENEKLREALADYGVHDSRCVLSRHSAGEPREDGYYTCFAGKWYRRGEWPKCQCGLDDAMKGRER